MGLALGAAIMLGVAASANGSTLEALILASCLALLALLRIGGRTALAGSALLGLAIGFGVTTARGVEGGAAVADPVWPEELRGTIVSDPRLSTVDRSAVLAWETNAGEPVETVVFYSGTHDIGRGDRVAVRGVRSRTIDTLYFVDRVETIAQAGPIERIRRDLRETAAHRILERTPGSNGSLALGLIVGDDSGLTGRERDDLRNSGLSHITAVSGSNVAMVIVAVGFLMQANGQRGRVWLGLQLSGVIFYVWIVGTDPPIVRAAIMGSLILIAGAIGRPTHLFTLLFLAGGVMCLLDRSVLASLSFQLSFLSMIGLALAANAIQRANGRSRKIAAALLSPAAAAIATAPLLAGRFGAVSLGTVPANIIVAPLIAPATGLAALASLIPDGFLTGTIAGLFLWGLTGSILWVSSFVASLPYAVVRFPALTTSQIVGCYLLLAMAALPLVPDARAAGYRCRLWISESPGPALASLSIGTVMLAALAFVVD